MNGAKERGAMACPVRGPCGFICFPPIRAGGGTGLLIVCAGKIDWGPDRMQIVGAASLGYAVLRTI